jgi:DNA (cytosine-5)-methyltransferase 1
MKLLSLFSGIGAFEKALDNLEMPYDLVAYCEKDKHASKSYSAIHGVPESMNLGDITKVDEKALPKDIDLVTYGFPCQDISLCGKLKGLFNEDGTQTRSGLFFEALRIIEETQPKVAIAENVKNLTSKKFAEQFRIVLGALESAGYHNYWEVLNAKDFGIPQNRERVFIVSIRKDIDTGMFRFPKSFPLKLRLKDMLEEVVDEKYYINETGNGKEDFFGVCTKEKKNFFRVREATKQGKALYTDYRKQSNPYGATAEQLASQGLNKSGYAETSQVNLYNEYQRNVTTLMTETTRLKAEADFQMNQAFLDADIQKAQNALAIYQQQAQLAITNYNLRYQKHRDDVADRQWEKSYQLQQQQAQQSQANWEREYQLSLENARRRS